MARSYQLSGQWVLKARWHMQRNLVFLLITASVGLSEVGGQELLRAFGAMLMLWGAIVLLSEDRLRLMGSPLWVGQAAADAAAVPKRSFETSISAFMFGAPDYELSLVQAEALCSWTAGSLLFIAETDNGVAIAGSAILLLLGAYRYGDSVTAHCCIVHSLIIMAPC